MELSGLIFVALALVWAVVLIPKALKHHDEAAETRAIEQVSGRMRVLARRHGGAETEESPTKASAPEQHQEDVRPVTRGEIQLRRAAAAAAARRRRWVLGLFLVITAGTGVGWYVGYLLPWAPAIPSAVTLLFLVVARITVRAERRRWDARLAQARGAVLPESRYATVESRDATVASTNSAVLAGPRGGEVSAVDHDGAAGAKPASADASADELCSEPMVVVPVQRNGQGLPVVSGLDDTQSFPVGLLEDIKPVADAAGSLWDPLPVTLPTYVTKPRATRTIRTIDLTDDDVASSGRDTAASALVAEAATAPPEDPVRRAVGS